MVKGLDTKVFNPSIVELTQRLNGLAAKQFLSVCEGIDSFRGTIGDEFGKDCSGVIQPLPDEEKTIVLRIFNTLFSEVGQRRDLQEQLPWIKIDKVLSNYELFILLLYGIQNKYSEVEGYEEGDEYSPLYFNSRHYNLSLPSEEEAEFASTYYGLLNNNKTVEEYKFIIKLLQENKINLNAVIKNNKGDTGVLDTLFRLADYRNQEALVEALVWAEIFDVESIKDKIGFHEETDIIHKALENKISKIAKLKTEAGQSAIQVWGQEIFDHLMEEFSEDIGHDFLKNLFKSYNVKVD